MNPEGWSLVDGKVDSFHHLSLPAGQRAVVAADLLLAKLLHFIGHIHHTSSEAERHEQQGHQQADLHTVAVVGTGRVAGAARAAVVALVTVTVRFLVMVVVRAMAVGVTEAVGGNGALLQYSIVQYS